MTSAKSASSHLHMNLEIPCHAIDGLYKILNSIASK